MLVNQCSVFFFVSFRIYIRFPLKLTCEIYRYGLTYVDYVPVFEIAVYWQEKYTPTQKYRYLRTKVWPLSLRLPAAQLGARGAACLAHLLSGSRVVDRAI